jgi:hypothetical protein
LIVDVSVAVKVCSMVFVRSETTVEVQIRVVGTVSMDVYTWVRVMSSVFVLKSVIVLVSVIVTVVGTVTVEVMV